MCVCPCRAWGWKERETLFAHFTDEDSGGVTAVNLQRVGGSQKGDLKPAWWSPSLLSPSPAPATHCEAEVRPILRSPAQQWLHESTHFGRRPCAGALCAPDPSTLIPRARGRSAEHLLFSGTTGREHVDGVPDESFWPQVEPSRLPTAEMSWVPRSMREVTQGIL